MKEKHKVKIYYFFNNGECDGTAYLDDDELETILSGESKRLIRFKRRFADDDDDKEFYVNPQRITEVWVERELSKTERS